jgi:hypothetical protein
VQQLRGQAKALARLDATQGGRATRLEAWERGVSAVSAVCAVCARSALLRIAAARKGGMLDDCRVFFTPAEQPQHCWRLSRSRRRPAAHDTP